MFFSFLSKFQLSYTYIFFSSSEVPQETRSFLRVLIIIYGQQLASRGWLSEAVRPANDAVIYKTRVASRFVFGWLFILSKYTQFWERPRRLSRDTNAGDAPNHIFSEQLFFSLSI